MRPMTEANVKAAFAGESQAHIKYLSFAERAERDGFANVARLFRAAAYAEQVHAASYLRILEGVGDTAGNLAAAITGETFEAEEMYQAYKVVAEAQGEKRALRSISNALAAEQVHAALYTAARQAVSEGQDATLQQILGLPGLRHDRRRRAPRRLPALRRPARALPGLLITAC